MGIKSIIGVVLCLMALSVNAALVERLGGQAVYDTDTNLLWLSDANLALSMDFGVSGIDQYGQMTWNTANTYIDAINSANYLGISNWQLPNTLQPDLTCSQTGGFGGDSGLNCTGSDMGHLFYEELGGTAGDSILINGNPTEVGKFENYGSIYWSATDWIEDSTRAYVFTFANGDTGGVQGANFKSGDELVWLVSVGDVPIPAAVWLFGSGLLGLIGVARRKA